MWIVVSVLVVLWLAGIHFYFPVPLVIGLFAALLVSVSWALLPSRTLRG